MENWIPVVASFIVGLFGKPLWDYFTKTSDNDTAVKIKALELDIAKAKELKEHNDGLVVEIKKMEQEVQRLTVAIGKFQSGFDMMMTVLKDISKGNPALMDALRRLEKDLKNINK